jgi:glycosyltransferase involved in cell wall biosynthesis
MKKKTSINLTKNYLSSLSKLQNKNHEFEIIYVDDGSTDNTLGKFNSFKE